MLVRLCSARGPGIFQDSGRRSLATSRRVDRRPTVRGVDDHAQLQTCARGAPLGFDRLVS